MKITKVCMYCNVKFAEYIEFPTPDMTVGICPGCSAIVEMAIDPICARIALELQAEKESFDDARR